MLLRSFARERLPWLLVLAVAGLMLVVAGLSHRTDVVFPEGAALTLGVLGLRLPDWSRSPVTLGTVPPLCAATGVALTYADLPRWAGELAALTAGFVVLHVSRSRLTPSLSAGAFPLVFGIHTWAYPLTVLAVCVVVAGLVAARPARPSREPLGRLPIPVAATAWAMAGAWVVLDGSVVRLGVAAVAPPLIVGMVERLATSDRSASTGVRHWAVVVVAAAVGSFAAANISPRWAGGVVAVAAVLVVLAVSGQPHPPALAVCLIPQVATTYAPGSYVAGIAAGAAVLYLAAGLIARVRCPAAPTTGAPAAPVGVTVHPPLRAGDQQA